MNLVLLNEADFIGPDRVALCGHRLLHMRQVHRACKGDSIRVGLLDGLMGKGVIEQISDQQATLRVQLDQPPPEPASVTLVLALPRPKMLKRSLRMLAELGIKQLYLVNSLRVEKSYWQSPWLQPEKLRECLMLGLEQARDTRLPEIHLRRRFKPFVEDELPDLLAAGEGLLAHPGSPGFSQAGLSLPISGPSLLCVGPEGGFITYEVEKLIAAGCTPFSLGPRIFRVETALPLLFGKLFEES